MIVGAEHALHRILVLECALHLRQCCAVRASKYRDLTAVDLVHRSKKVSTYVRQRSHRQIQEAKNPVEDGHDLPTEMRAQQALPPLIADS
jgi:hypothetical protein